MKVRLPLGLWGLLRVPGAEQTALYQRVKNVALEQDIRGQNLAPSFESCVTLGTVPASLNLSVSCVNRVCSASFLGCLGSLDAWSQVSLVPGVGKTGETSGSALVSAAQTWPRTDPCRQNRPPTNTSDTVLISCTLRFQTFPGCPVAWVLLTQQSSLLNFHPLSPLFLVSSHCPVGLKTASLLGVLSP